MHLRVYVTAYVHDRFRGLVLSYYAYLCVSQVVLGRVGVYMASLLERKRAPVGGASAAGKKHGFRVTSSEVAQAYHLLHQISMTGAPVSHLHSFIHSRSTISSTAPGVGSHLKGMGLYLSLSALNFAETDRPQRRLPGPVVSEMYFSLGLQSSVSVPYLSSLAMVSCTPGCT